MQGSSEDREHELFVVFLFFFQAEDGIRDLTVTGVQTCALPIWTYGAMSLSGSKLVHRRGFSPLVPDIHHVPYPRGVEARTDPDYGKHCVKQIEDTLLKRVVPPEEVAAIFVEPIQGAGGYHVPPPDFLAA